MSVVPVRRAPRLPLSSKSTRVLLLAWSYLDARFSRVGEEVIRAHPGPRVRLPESNVELWERGSYAEFQRALDELRQTDPSAHLFFWSRHVAGEFPPPAVAPELAQVIRLMGEFVYVPQEVSEAAGYRPSEAQTWARSRERRAA